MPTLIAHGLPPRKDVKTPSGETYSLHLCTMGGTACSHCGKDLHRNADYLVACDDCGGLFCESCVADGSFEGHDCQDDDEGDW